MSDVAPAGPLCVNTEGQERERRVVRLSVRVTEAERAAIDRRAAALGVKSSAWVRAALRDELHAGRAEVARIHAAARVAPAAVSPEVGRAIEQLRRVGANLNQITRRVNAGEVDGVDAGALADVLAAVEDLRAHLGDRTAT